KTSGDIEGMKSGLRTPGMAVLLDRMNNDSRMFFTLPLGAFMEDRTYFSERATSGLVVVGRSPAFLQDSAPAGPGPFLWGSLPRGLPGLTNSRVGPVKVRQVAPAPLSSSYVEGTGLRRKTGDEAVLLLSPANAQTLGVSGMYSASDLSLAFTCNCGVDDLAPLAGAMTEAERKADSHRVFYALSYDGIIGPVERSNSVSEVLDMVFAAGTLLSVTTFSYMSVLMFWKRREHDYAVEQQAGASEWALHLRQQTIIAMAVTFPILAGFLFVDAAVRGDQPVPWPRAGGPLTLLLVLALHLALGTRTATKVHRLYVPSKRGW
ncbi:MAG: hypothetical protein P8Z68_11680, partial [Kineosporiaceae bacterium]